MEIQALHHGICCYWIVGKIMLFNFVSLICFELFVYSVVLLCDPNVFVLVLFVAQTTGLLCITLAGLIEVIGDWHYK